MALSLLHELEILIQSWAREHAPDLGPGPWIKPCQDERFGHFQTNIAMVAAKTLKQNPRELAADLVVFFSRDPRLLPPEIAGPGFVNLRFTRAALEQALTALHRDPTAAILPAPRPATIVLDFSGPNVAKEMHVGHIRSTILGDALGRILTALGHHVIRDNHLGDWGTQFGKMILGYKQAGLPPLQPDTAIAAMEGFYKSTHEACEKDQALLEQARQELVKLQNGDPENIAIWTTFRNLSQSAFDAIYTRLGTRFDHTLAESFYNPWLQEVVESLLAAGVARESEGAVAIFHDPSVPPEKSPFLVKNKDQWVDVPMLIRKSDGAALYATTDLATVRYRVQEWKADTLLYVTDGRQQQHFAQLFDASRRWGFTPTFQHVWFGAVLGADGKPLKTRDGSPLKLRDLLDEAEARAGAILREKRPEWPAAQLQETARIIGIGALKYADLSQNRNLDYTFDWDKLLAFDGNTAPYLLNAYVRTRSILRKAGAPPALPLIQFREDTEMDLARKLLALGDTLHAVTAEYRPHLLCAYLYETASLFHRFFEHCPVLKAESEEIKNSRLVLCDLTGRTLRQGLSLLGIETVEEM
jgi:arginyl-tRNA synthetase